MKIKIFLVSVMLSITAFIFLSDFNFANSENVDELKQKIEDKNAEVKLIEEEIEKFQNEINKTVEEKKTLDSQVRQLQSTSNKLKAEINLTEKKIESANFTIEKLTLETQKKEEEIEKSKQSLAEILRELDKEDSKSMLEILLAHNSLSEFFNNIEQMNYLQKDINIYVTELKSLKIMLEDQQAEKEKERDNHEQLNAKLDDQKQLVEINKNQKNSLLNQTKNKESSYRKILDEKIAKRDKFLSEMAELEAQLQIEIDPTRLPSVGTGLLKWPMDDVSLADCSKEEGKNHKNCITQFFGNTPFATENPQVYGGNGHNGLDFRGSVGSAVKSSLSGMVVETGNTDLIPGCYSYGKWVMIDHKNGLTTLYAHLSLIKVQKGQEVTTRELIGYSGDTGYATGPHLHYTVYATQGVQIVRLGDIKKITNCANARIPIADKTAYLNPLSYLSSN